MSPIKGKGANQALLDNLSLQRNVYRHFHISSSSSLDTALERHEAEMTKRHASKAKAYANAVQCLCNEVAIRKGDVTRRASVKQEWRGQAGMKASSNIV